MSPHLAHSFLPALSFRFYSYFKFLQLIILCDRSVSSQNTISPGKKPFGHALIGLSFRPRGLLTVLFNAEKVDKI